ncbi:MAG: hypothetical protein HY549_02740 [Elusimicrobia bacterium]|nr:hypothetical protein [Elusimicrobiota bacterium]
MERVRASLCALLAAGALGCGTQAAEPPPEAAPQASGTPSSTAPPATAPGTSPMPFNQPGAQFQQTFPVSPFVAPGAILSTPQAPFTSQPSTGSAPFFIQQPGAQAP